MLPTQDTTPERLCLGEAAQINGRLVERIGLFGAGVYLVDGLAMSLDEAIGATLHCVEAQAEPAARLPITLAGLVAGYQASPPSIATAAPPSPSSKLRSRQRQQVRRAGSVQGTAALSLGGKPIAAVPELLAEVRAALLTPRAFKLVHRAFDGGEAVTVSIHSLTPYTPTEEMQAYFTATNQFTSAGFYVERDASGRSLVVAANKAALHPAPKPKSGKAPTKGGDKPTAKPRVTT